jgi:hypothetical protein
VSEAWSYSESDSVTLWVTLSTLFDKAKCCSSFSTDSIFSTTNWVAKETSEGAVEDTVKQKNLKLSLKQYKKKRQWTVWCDTEFQPVLSLQNDSSHSLWAFKFFPNNCGKS